jgi:mannose-6-phosphate isomerase
MPCEGWVNMFFRKAGKSRVSQPMDSVFAALAPFLIEPRLVGRVWGWSDLHPWYNHVADKEPIGEVWLSGDECKVASGPHTGSMLREVFQKAPEAMLGKGSDSSESPLLIKVIFAREKLSVQVHPDDRLARKYREPRGKTECWYALAAEPYAQVAVGLTPDTTMSQVKAGIEEGTLERSLAMMPVKAGDMIYVDAGTVHAIWPGSVLLEIQQNSDLTYRMYDYGRGRELHIEKSLEAMQLSTSARKVLPDVLADRTILVNADYFCVEKIAVEVSRSSTTLPGEGEKLPGLSYLFAAEGGARLSSPSFETIELPARGIVAVPAASPVFAIRDLGGLDLIRISPRRPGQA